MAAKKMLARPFSWEFADGVIDLIEHAAEFKRRARQRGGFEESEDFASHSDGSEGDELPDIDTRPRTSEIRCWASVPKDSVRGSFDRVLLRFQRVPIHGYLQVPEKIILRSGKKLEWDASTISVVVKWMRRELARMSRGYMLTVVKAEYVKRDLLHFYQDESRNVSFLLIYFNTRKAATLMHEMIHGRADRDAGEMFVEEKMMTFRPEQDWTNFAVRLHETHVDPIVYFTAVKDLQMTDWLRVNAVPVEECPRDRYKQRILSEIGGVHTREFLADWESAECAPDMTEKFLPRTLTYDLEVYTKVGPFPDASTPADEIFMISQITQTADIETTRRCKLFTTVQTTRVGIDRCEDVRGEIAREAEAQRGMRTVHGGSLAANGGGDVCRHAFAEIDGTRYEVVYCSSERELIKTFFLSLMEYDPDFILGYNTDNFDAPYLATRAELNRVKDVNVGRLRTTVESSRIYSRNFEKAKGMKKQSKSWIVPGRFSFDLLPYMQKDRQMRSYTLNAVSKEVLNESKLDVSAADMFKSFAKQREALLESARGDEARAQYLKRLGKSVDYYLHESRREMDRIGDYCIVDSILVQRLFDKLCLQTLLTEFSNIVNVPMSYLYSRGQQIRVFSQILLKCTMKNIVIDRQKWEIMQVAGATVQVPIVGVSDDVICLDFSSLYPSIMMGYNICYSTLIPREKWHMHRKDDCNIFEIIQMESENPDEGAEHVIMGADFEGSGTVEEPPSDDEDEDTLDVDRRAADALVGAKLIKVQATEVRKSRKANVKMREVRREVRFIKREKKTGIVYEILEQLIAQRKKTKREMEKYEPDSFEYIRLDKRQLALKITANATYGFLGCQSKGMLPLPEGFACVTARGRQLIGTVNSKLVEEYNATIVYGDTDSTMFTIPGVTGAACHAKGHELQKVTAVWFPPPIKMEFEKAMRILLFGKKSYAYYFISEEGADTPFVRNAAGTGYKLKTMGLKPARRDNCPFQVSIFKDSVVQLLNLTPPTEMIDTAIANLVKMFRGELDISNFAINKAMGFYDDDSKSSMLTLARNMENKGMPVRPGERIDYVIVRQNDPNDYETQDARITTRMRTVEWIKSLPEDRCPMIDLEWYTLNALKKMNEPINMACEYWARSGKTQEEREQRRAALTATVGVFSVPKSSNKVEFALVPNPMQFIGLCALAARAGGKRETGEALIELQKALHNLFERGESFKWHMEGGRCVTESEIAQECASAEAARRCEREQKKLEKNRENREKSRNKKAGEDFERRVDGAEIFDKVVADLPKRAETSSQARNSKNSISIFFERKVRANEMAERLSGMNARESAPAASMARKEVPAATRVKKICATPACGSETPTNRHKYCEDCRQKK